MFSTLRLARLAQSCAARAGDEPSTMPMVAPISRKAEPCIALTSISGVHARRRGSLAAPRGRFQVLNQHSRILCATSWHAHLLRAAYTATLQPLALHALTIIPPSLAVGTEAAQHAEGVMAEEHAALLKQGGGGLERVASGMH